jgi:hypothetical protein
MWFRIEALPLAISNFFAIDQFYSSLMLEYTSNHDHCEANYFNDVFVLRGHKRDFSLTKLDVTSSVSLVLEEKNT